MGLVVCALVLPRLLGMGFLLDDRELCFENPAIARFDLGAILGSDLWAFRGGLGMYRPLTSLSLALDAALFGTSPAGFHATSFVLHGLAALALASAVARLRPGLFAPALALLLLHPVGAEQAAWISARGGSIALGLGGVALLNAQRGRLVLAAACCFAAAHAREDGIVFVAIVALLVPGGARRRFVPLALAALTAWLALRFAVLGSLVAPARGSHYASLGALDRLGVAARAFGAQVAMLGLVERPLLLRAGVPDAGPWALALPALLLALVLGRRRRPLRDGLAVVLCAFLPFAHLLPFGGTVHARHAWALLPGILLAASLPARFARRATACLVLLLAPFFAAQLRTLASEELCYAQILEHEPSNRRARLALALAGERAGKLDEVRTALERLVADEPSYAKASVNLGRLLWQAGEVAAAERLLAGVTRAHATNARAPLTLGRLYFARRRFAEAARAFELCLERNPREAQAARYLARARLALGQLEKARAALDRARALDPASAWLVRVEASLRRAEAKAR